MYPDRGTDVQNVYRIDAHMRRMCKDKNHTST